MDKEECLLFVAHEQCNRESEFRKAYRNRYGQSAEDIEILGVYLIDLLYHNGVEKEYRIQIVGK